MVHRNARLAEAGRLILVRRVLAGRPVSHVARELGVSRTCAHRWVSRFRLHGLDGLRDRSSRPRTTPTATSGQVAAALLHARQAERLGRDELARRFGVSPSTASRLIARAGLPALHELDPITGVRIRASRRTQHRYERERPGDLIHIDVKKLGRIPDTGGWRVEGPATLNHHRTADRRKQRIGFDYIHVAVDDHSRLAFAQVLPDEKGATCAGFLTDAAAFFVTHGIDIREVMTDNALNYGLSRLPNRSGSPRRETRPHPRLLALAERQSRTLQPHPPGGLGIPATVHLEPGPTRRPLSLARALQLRSTPHRLRRPTPDHPRDTNLMTRCS